MDEAVWLLIFDYCLHVEACSSSDELAVARNLEFMKSFWLVKQEPSNLNALVDAIEMLVRDPARRLALSNAGIKAAAGFDRNKLADRLLDALLALSEKPAN